MGLIVGVVETFNVWCRLECHAYLSKPSGAGLFRCTRPFDERYALIIHYCVVSIEMPCILKQSCCYRFCLSMTIWQTQCITLLSYNAWWPVGWYAYLKRAVNFVDCVWHFTGRSILWIFPLVNSVHGNVGIYLIEVVFFWDVCGHLVDVMHYAFIF